MLTVWGKKPQRSHPVDCGDVAGWARGVTNLRGKWHVLIASCEAQNIPMTLSSCRSSLHSSLIHFYSSSARYLSGHFHLENTHINQLMKLCKLAKFSLSEMKIPREPVTESVVTRSTFIRVATYYPAWLTVCWSPCLCECANMMWFSSSVKARLHAVWLILASSNPQTAVCRLLPLPHSPQLFPAPNC